MVLAKDLREAVLQAAFEGKLSYNQSWNMPQLISNFQGEEPNDIPENWKWYILKDLVWNRKQKKPIEDFCYIDIGSIDNVHHKLNEKENIILASEAPSRARKPVLMGDIIYSTVRPYLHNIAIIDRNFSLEAIASTGFATLVCNDGVYNKYLFYYLLSPVFDRYVNDTDNSKGVAYPAINDKKLYLAPVPVCSLEEQAHIVAKVDELMAKIDEYEKLENELEELKKKFPNDMKDAILQAAIEGKLTKQEDSDISYKSTLTDYSISNIETDLNVPLSWQCIRLGDVLEIVRGGSPRPIKDFITNDSKGINWIKISDTEKDQKYIYKTKEKIKSEGVKRSRYVIENTFLLTNSMSFGRPYILKTRGCIHDGWLALEDKYKLFVQDYLYWILSSNYVYKQFADFAAGAVVKNLNINKVCNTVIPLPPLEEQQRMVEVLNKVLPLCENL